MRIGVDIDDVLCKTTELVHECLEKYSNDFGINELDVMNDEELKDNFFNIYREEIYRNAEVKKNCSNVLKRLRSKGNEIYLVTGRTRFMETSSYDIFQITEDWLKKNSIEADAIITSAHGETKADACKKYNIDVMIDDDPLNYQKITSIGKKCLLFDDHGRFALKKDYVTDWLEVEKEIEEMNK